MNYGYIINNGDDSLSIYYYANGAVMKRNTDKGVRGKAECIVSDVRPFFSLSVRKGEPVLIYRRISGDVVLLSRGDSRVLQKCSDRLDTEVYLSAIMEQRRMRLIYINGVSLVTQSSDDSGSTEAVRLDELTGNLSYRLIPVVKGGYALLYNRRMPEMQFGYREITAAAVGDFRRVYATGFDIGDSSVCSTEDTLHIVFVSMSRFAVRVMYTRRINGSFGRPRNLWEGSRCGNVCVACDGCDVFVWWESGGHIFESTSSNGGESFGQCIRKGSAAVYSKALHLAEGSFCISEVMLSENGEIYAPAQVKELIARHRVVSVPEVHTAKCTEGYKGDSVNRLVTELREELAKKQQEVERLSHTLLTKNQESNKREFKLRQQYRELKQELDRLKNEDIRIQNDENSQN